MGTHPIFESDFDCLTDKNAERSARLFILPRDLPLGGALSDLIWHQNDSSQGPCQSQYIFPDRRFNCSFVVCLLQTVFLARPRSADSTLLLCVELEQVVLRQTSGLLEFT